MREILFRGKRVDNGEWVKGGIAYYGEKVFIVFVHRSHSEMGDMHLPKIVEVRPETVGQYAGVKDKNGKKIFDGDIVKYANGVCKVVFESRCGTAFFGIVISEMTTWFFGKSPADLMDVVGNIHDNPELLDA